VKLTGCLYLVPKLGMNGAVPLFHPYALLAQAGVTLIQLCTYGSDEGI
jgi:hypothetical protein